MTSIRVRAFALGSCLLFVAPAIWAQKDRIHEPIDSARRVAISTSVSSNARLEFDQGPVDPAMKIGYIQMTLKPSDEQQASLEKLLEDQQDPVSPDFHKWLTPEQFADQFGASANDIATLERWLTSQGFTLIQTSRARNWIAFGGTASQVRAALNTEIRNYRVDGEVHFANATAPSIPAGLAPLVRGFLGLNDFRVPVGPRSLKRLGSTLPQFTGSNGAHALAPADMSVIYNTNPLYRLGFTGIGQKLVIIGASAIIPSDIASFRSTFGLAPNPLTSTLVPGSTDPGQNGAMDEADADLEWSAALAPGVTQFYIYSSNLLFAVNYALSQNLAPVISMSFGVCEAKAATYGLSAGDMQPLAQQANSQGVTILVSSGDAGAAGCDVHSNPGVTAASNGLGVNLFASPPEVTSVGGTMFNEGIGNYWASGNNAQNGSALSYIPETSWNESLDGGGLNSSGGGFSLVYANPVWQSAGQFTGISARVQPDVSLTAAGGHDGYLVFSNGGFSVVGGTSLSTPSFAGMIALLNQYTKSSGQGNINPNIYRLAQSTTGIFHDITSGSNIVPCIGGSPNCPVGGGSFGYNAGVGFDLVTGWGSVDAYNLITNWSASQLQTNITVTANPPNFLLNGSTTLTATVNAIGSSAIPTGTVTFLLGQTSLGASILVGAGNGRATASVTIFASQLPAGNDTITVSYGGDRNFTGVSTHITVGVSVPSGGASAVIPLVTPIRCTSRPPIRTAIAGFTPSG
jgi:subtilase family serine protease